MKKTEDIVMFYHCRHCLSQGNRDKIAAGITNVGSILVSCENCGKGLWESAPGIVQLENCECEECKKNKEKITTCKCLDCGWEGIEEDVDYDIRNNGELDMAVDVCPECKSDNIIE